MVTDYMLVITDNKEMQEKLIPLAQAYLTETSFTKRTSMQNVFSIK